MLTAFRQRWMLPRREMARATIGAAIQQADLRAELDADTVIDSRYAPIYYRLRLDTGTLLDSYVDGLFKAGDKGVRG